VDTILDKRKKEKERKEKDKEKVNRFDGSISLN